MTALSHYELPFSFLLTPRGFHAFLFDSPKALACQDGGLSLKAFFLGFSIRPKMTERSPAVRITRNEIASSSHDAGSLMHRSADLE